MRETLRSWGPGATLYALVVLGGSVVAGVLAGWWVRKLWDDPDVQLALLQDRYRRGARRFYAAHTADVGVAPPGYAKTAPQP